MKELMDGYVGVKFKAVLVDPTVPFDIDAVFPQFQKSCRLLGDHGLTPQNAGNICVRYRQGFIITASGSHLGGLERDEIVFVASSAMEAGVVEYMGPKVPSSETFMHSMILDCRPLVQAVVHVHDPETLDRAATQVEATDREVPYGTPELAKLACDTFSETENNIIVLKNHGYLAVGGGLAEAVDLVIDTQRKIRARGLDAVVPR